MFSPLYFSEGDESGAITIEDIKFKQQELEKSMKTIFVSSTFNDMQHERDVLQNIVANRLNSIAKQYGDSVSFRDLRWGVNTLELTEQEASEKVLEVCLDGIDRSDPPMIVLLGDRYGWIPGEQILKSVAHRKAFDSLDDLEISVTALEIEYGALQNEDKLNNTFFYFRTIVGSDIDIDMAEDEKHRQKLLDLKERIKKSSHGRVREYSVTYQDGSSVVLDEFAEMVYADLIERFLPEWKKTENYSPEEKEIYIHQKVAEGYDKYFSANFNEYSKLKEFVSRKNAFCLISGRDGSGKTTLLSHLACNLKNTETNVFWMQIGLTTLSQTYADFLQTLHYYVKKTLSCRFVESDDIEQDILINTKESRDDFCVLIDGIDKFTSAEQNKVLHFLKRLSQFATVIVTNIDYIKVTGLNVELNGLCETEARKTVLNYLKLKGRELPKTIVDKIVSQATNTVLDVILDTKNNAKRAMPIHLIQLINTLLLFNGDDFRIIKKYGNDMLAICKYQEEIIDSFPYDWRDQAMLNINKIANTTRYPLLINALAVLSFSKTGLRHKDFIALMGEEWTDLYLENLICFFGHMLVSKNNGIYAFENETLRIACNHSAKNYVQDKIWRQVLKELAENDIHEENEFDFTYADLFEYLNTLDDNDEIKVSEYMSCAKNGNIDFDKVVSYISKVQKSLKLESKHITSAQFYDVFFVPCFTNEISEKYLVKKINELEYINDNVIFLEFLLQEMPLKNEWNNLTIDTFHKVYKAILQKTKEFVMKEKNEMNANNFIFATTLLIELLLQKGCKKTALNHLENMYVVLEDRWLFELLTGAPTYYFSVSNAILFCYTENKDKAKAKQMLNLVVHNVIPSISSSSKGSISLYTNAIKAGFLVDNQNAVDKCLQYILEQSRKKDSLSIDDVYFIEKIIDLTIKYFSLRNNHQECLRWLFECIIPMVKNKQDNLYPYANDTANNLESMNDIYTDTIKMHIDFPTPQYMQQAMLACEELVDVCDKMESLYPGTFKEKRIAAYVLFAKCIIVSDNKCFNSCFQKVAEGLFAFAKYMTIDSIIVYMRLIDYGIESNCCSTLTTRNHIEKLIELSKELLSSVEFTEENNVLINFLRTNNVREEIISKINKIILFFNKNVRLMDNEQIEAVKALKLRLTYLQ